MSKPLDRILITGGLVISLDPRRDSVIWSTSLL